MKKLFTLFAVCSCVLSLSVLQTATAQTYTGTMSGPAESPANASPGTGTVTVTITGTSMRVQCTFSDLTGTTTASHIHAATATAGTGTAGVATQTPSFSGFPLGVTSGTYDHTFDMTLSSSWNSAYITAHNDVTQAFTDFLAALNAGKAYYNVHSNVVPGGEIRCFLTSCTATSITTDPQTTQTVCQNSNAQDLQVTATGSDLTYQWYSNTTNSNSGGTAISTDGTSDTYTPSATTAGTTYYYVVVTGSCGAVTSSTATVAVNSVPTAVAITAGGATTFCFGGSVSLTSSSASGNQWYQDGSLISGATNQTYTAGTTGSYTVMVSASGCTSVVSSGTYVTVTPLASVNSIANQTLCNGASTTAVSFTGTANTYSWTNNNTSIGLAVSGTGDISSFTATNSTVSPVTATITVTPKKVSYAYISKGNSEVSVVNTATNTVATSIPVGTDPTGVSVSPDGSKVYVSNYSSNTLSVIDAATNTVSATVTCGTHPNGVVVSPDGSKIYVANSNSNDVSVVDATSNTVTATVATGGNVLGGVCISPDGNTLYVVSAGTNSVSVINTQTNTLTTTISVGFGPAGIVITNDGSTVYVCNHFSASVSVINTATNTVATSIGVGTQPLGIALEPNGTHVYVSNYGSGNVSVIETATNTVTSTVAVGGNPSGISVAPDGTNVYVSLGGSGNVSIINTGTFAVDNTVGLGAATGPMAISQSACAGTPATFTITVNPTPSTPSITRSGTTALCTGGSVTFTSSSATGNQWYKDGNPISGETNQTYVATQSGDYSVKVTSTCTSAASNVYTVTVNAVPPTPVITASGATTFCAGSSVTLTGHIADGNAINLTGSNYLSVKTVNTFPAGNTSYTIEAWIKPVNSGNSGIAGWGNYGTGPQTNAFRLNGATQLVNYWWGPDLIVTVPNLEDGQWHHVAATFDGTTRSIYSDGILRGSDNPGTHNVTQVDNVTIGKTVGTETFQGGMDEMRIWTVARTQAQLVASMYSPIAANTTGLTAYYKMDEGTGTTVADATANANTATWVNTTSWMVPSTSPVSSYSYAWSSGQTIPVITATASGNYTVTATNSSSCSSTSAATSITVNPIPSTPTITAGGPTTFCTGSSVTLTSSSATGNQWYKGGSIISGATSNTYAATASGTYTVTVTSLSCTSAASAGTTVIVNTQPASVTITSPTTAVCVGSTITFTATPVNGGTSPSYQWKINNNNAGTDASTFTTTISNGDVVKAVMTSNATPCLTGSPATSNSITLFVPNTFDALGLNCLSSSGAYSLRKLSSGYAGSAVNVRRSNDNTTQNIGFTATGDLDTASLKTFVGVNSGFVTKWYDQNGNGNDAIQATAANQPRIVNAGVVDRINKRPAVTFVTSAMWMSSTTTTTVQTVNAVRNLIGANYQTLFAMSANADFSIRANGGFNGTTVLSYANGPNFGDWVFNTGTTPTNWVNGLQSMTGTTGLHTLTASAASARTSNFSISTTFTSRGMASGDGVSELVLFPSTLSTSDRQSIEASQKLYYINTNGNLSNLALSSGTLSPTFASATTSYSASVSNATSSITVTPTVSDVTATVTVNGTTVPSGNASGAISLVLGTNTITIVVTGQDGTTTKTYTVSVCRAPATPTITAGGATAFCAGGSVTLTSSSASGNQWYLNGSAIGSATSSTYNATASGDYTVAVTSGGCSSAASTATTVSVNPLPTAAISGTTTVCSNTTAPNVTFTGAAGTAPYTFTYKINSGSNLTVTTTSGNSVTVAAPTGTAGTFVYTLISVQDNSITHCSQTQSGSATVTVNNCTNDCNWTGLVSTDWNNASNWACGVVPSGNLYNVIIASSSNTPVLTSDVEINNVTFQSGMNINLGGKTFTVDGNVSGTGSFKGSSTSSLVINGAAGTLSFASGYGTLSNLTLTSSSTMTLGAILGVYGTVSVGSGAVLNAAGYLNLKSNLSTTGRVSTLTTGSITGNVVVERYIPANLFQAWRLLSVPVQGSQTFRQAWQENQAPMVVGPTGYGTLMGQSSGTGFDYVAVASVGSSVKTWTQSTGSWDVTVGSTGNVMQTRSGYLLYIKGDRSITPSMSTNSVNPTVLRTAGTLYQGNQTSPSVAAGKYGILGNIYPSAIDFRQLTMDTTTGFYNTFYLWDPKLYGASGAGAYQTFSKANNWMPVPGGGSFPAGTANTTIQQGAAFMVIAKAAGGTIGFSEAAKMNSNNNVFTRTGAMTRIMATLSIKGSEAPADGNTVVFAAGYSENVPKPQNIDENFVITAEGQSTSVSARSSEAKNGDRIVYNLSNLKEGQQYIIELNAENFNGQQAYLDDSYLHTTTPINLDGKTTVSFIADSSTTGRFTVVFGKSIATPTIAEAGKITVAPNPVTGRVVNLQFTNKADGAYTLSFTNAVGQEVYTTTVNHTGNSSIQELKLPKLGQGIYHMQITTADGKTESQRVVVN